MEYSVRLRELYEQMKIDQFYSNKEYLLSVGIEKRVALGVDEKIMAAVTVLYSDRGEPDFLLCFIVLLFSENNPNLDFLNRFKDIKLPIVVYPDNIDGFLDSNNISIKGLKESLRKQSLPLPVHYFPDEHDNTSIFMSKLFPPEYSKPGMMAKCENGDRRMIIEQLYRHTTTQSINDSRTIAAGNQSGTTEQDASKDELVEQLLSQTASTPQAIAQILTDFQISPKEAAKRLKVHKVTLKEIGRVLREEGEFDSDDANQKRAQRLLSN